MPVLKVFIAEFRNRRPIGGNLMMGSPCRRRKAGRRWRR
jgi:hypothetical protein